jgi:hypothetical protein
MKTAALLSLLFISSVFGVVYPGTDSTCAFPHDGLTTAYPPVLDAVNSKIAVQGGSTVLLLSIRASKNFFQADMFMQGENNSALCGQQFAAVVDPTDPDCHYLIQATIQWANHDTCGVTLDASSSTPQYSYFRGAVNMTEHEQLSAIRGTALNRTLSRVLPFYVRFPLTVSASTNITVSDNPYILAAIIKQADARSSAATSLATGDIVMYTNVQPPFKLSSAVFAFHSRNDFTTGAPSARAPPLLSGGTCNDVASQPCEQEWNFLLSGTSPPLCNFTGDWTITFTVVCQASAGATCPLPSGETTVYSIPFHLTTENFCPVVFADVRLSASLSSFQDPEHTISKSNFLLGATSYFVAAVSSPDAQIVQTTLHTASSSGLTLYDAGSVHDSVFTITPAGTLAATQSHFNIVLNPSKFPVPVDSSAQFNIAVTLDVVFANTGSNGLRRVLMLLNPTLIKPHLLAAGGQPDGIADARAQVSLSTTDQTGPLSGASSVVGSFALVVALVGMQLVL